MEAFDSLFRSESDMLGQPGRARKSVQMVSVIVGDGRLACNTKEALCKIGGGAMLSGCKFVAAGEHVVVKLIDIQGLA